MDASKALFENLLEAAWSLDEQAAGRTPLRERVLAGAIALDTLMRRGELDRDLQDATLGLKEVATGGVLELDAVGRERAAYLAQRVQQLAATLAPPAGVSLSQPCRESLYRIVWESRAGAWAHAFTLAHTPDQARHIFHHAIAAITGQDTDELELYNLTSYRELIDRGVSEEMRVFESGWQGMTVASWVERPLFLTADPTLVGKWAQLQAELAAQRAADAIRDAAGRRS